MKNEQESETEREDGTAEDCVVERVGEGGTGEEGVDGKEVESSVADGEDNESDKNVEDYENDEEDGEGGKNDGGDENDNEEDGEDSVNRGGNIFVGQSSNEFQNQEHNIEELSYVFQEPAEPRGTY